MSARDSRNPRAWIRARASRLAPLLLVATAIGFNLFVFRAEVRSGRGAERHRRPHLVGALGGEPTRARPPRVRRLVPAPLVRCRAVPPLPEPRAHPRRRDRAGRRRRPLRRVVELPARLPVAALRVLVGAALPVRPLDRRHHGVDLAARLVGDALRVRARQLPVAGQRHLDRALGHVAAAARARVHVARGLAREGLRARRALSGRDHHRALPHRLPRDPRARRVRRRQTSRHPAARGARGHRRRRERARRRVGDRPPVRRQQVLGPNRVQQGHLLVELVRRQEGHGLAVHGRAVRLRALAGALGPRGDRRARVLVALARRAGEDDPRLHAHRPVDVLRPGNDRPDHRSRAARRQGPAAAPLHHRCALRRHRARRSRCVVPRAHRVQAVRP